MLGFFRFGEVKIAVYLAQHISALEDQRQEGKRQNQPQATADGETA